MFQTKVVAMGDCLVYMAPTGKISARRHEIVQAKLTDWQYVHAKLPTSKSTANILVRHHPIYCESVHGHMHGRCVRPGHLAWGSAFENGREARVAQENHRNLHALVSQWVGDYKVERETK